MDTIDTISIGMLRVFTTVAQEGGFAEAGRQLGSSRTVVSRQIAQFEDLIGIRLFERTTRRVALTEDGEILLSQAAPGITALRDMLAAAKLRTAGTAGTVRMSSSHAFGRYYVMPSLAAFRALHPDIMIDVELADRIDDLIEPQLDLVIRIGQLPDSSIVARKMGELPIVFAVPAALAKSSRTLAMARSLPAIGFRVPGSGRLYDWNFEKAGQRTNFTPTNPVLTTSSIEGVADLVIAGHGAAPVPRYLVADAITSGVVHVGLDDYKQASIPVHICFTASRLMPKRVRLLVDHLSVIKIR
jgi:LysR family transcriptional regulator, regulator for bpeEF and oprC